MIFFFSNLTFKSRLFCRRCFIEFISVCWQMGKNYFAFIVYSTERKVINQSECITNPRLKSLPKLVKVYSVLIRWLLMASFLSSAFFLLFYFIFFSLLCIHFLVFFFCFSFFWFRRAFSFPLSWKMGGNNLRSLFHPLMIIAKSRTTIFNQRKIKSRNADLVN